MPSALSAIFGFGVWTLIKTLKLVTAGKRAFTPTDNVIAWRLQGHGAATGSPSYGKRHTKECMQNFKLSPKCTEMQCPAQLTCVVVIACVSGAFGGDLAVIGGAAWKIDFTLILRLQKKYNWSIRVKSIFHAAPPITAKSPPNRRNHQRTGKLSWTKYFIAFQYILGTV